MKKFVVIIICAAVAAALGVAGVIIFMPKGEAYILTVNLSSVKTDLWRKKATPLTEHRRIFRWMSA